MSRSAESSSEEMSEEDFENPQASVSPLMTNLVTTTQSHDSPSGASRQKRSASRSSSEESEEVKVPKPGFNSSTVNPVTRLLGNTKASGISHKERKGRSAESSSEDSSKEKVKAPKPGFNSSTVNPVTRLLGNTKFSSKSPKERKGRSAEFSSEESSEDDIDSSGSSERQRRSASRSSSEDSSKEKPGFNSSTVNPVTRPLGKNPPSGGIHTERKGRSAESSSKESDERNTWTLYGLFQLPDRIACTSGSEPSLNLCSMACDSEYTSHARYRHRLTLQNTIKDY